MATGVAHRLARSGFQVLLTETARPLAVRRAASFCEAVYEGSMTVEGMTARLVENLDLAPALWERGQLPLMIEPDPTNLTAFTPWVLVDAIMAKSNTGTRRDMAPLTIGLGPGFTAGHDVHLVVETNRGHNLGRVIHEGQAEADTGVPGVIAGFSGERVLRAPVDGQLTALASLGEMVEAGRVVARVGGQEVKVSIGGMMRGLVRDGTPVTTGLKIGDVDPRGRLEYLRTISEKARAIGGGVLEGILGVYNR